MILNVNPMNSMPSPCLQHWSKELVSTGGPQPRVRLAHAAVALSSQALLSSGGYSGRELDDCWILDLSTWRWREVGGHSLTIECHLIAYCHCHGSV